MSSINSQSPTSAINYSQVFDRSIYDQNELFPDGGNQNVSDEKIIKHLAMKKRQRLDEVLIRNAQRRAEQYREVIQSGKSWWNHRIKPVLGGLPFVNWKGIEDTFKEIPQENAKQKLYELIFEIDLLINGIDKEQICDLENQYILRKRYIKSPGIIEQIEMILLLAREQSVPIELYRQFIQNVLSVPNTPLKISLNSSQKIQNNSFIKNYAQELRSKIVSIARKIIFDSNQPDNSKTSIRSIHYFRGDPGTGKSTTARIIADELNLPYFVCSIRSAKDLTAESLEGTPRTLHSHNPGLLANALMSKNGEGKTYENTILIIDDYDRLLFPDGGGSVSAALAFFLDYLDPDKKSYFNPYFLADINIRRLTIIVTANKSIPNKPDDLNSPDPYAALRSRVSETHFPNFDEPTLMKICLPYAVEIGAKYNFPPETIDASKREWVGKAIKNQKEQSGVLEPRDLKRQIENLVLDSLIDP